MDLRIGPTFADELTAANISLDGLSWDAGAGVLIASSGDDQRAAAETVLAKHDPAKAAVVIPLSVTNYQARAVLVERGLFDKVDAALRSADLGVTANKVALQAWDYANGFSRSSALVAAMAGALGLSPADVDALFVAAAAVP